MRFNKIKTYKPPINYEFKQKTVFCSTSSSIGRMKKYKLLLLMECKTSIEIQDHFIIKYKYRG